MNADQVLRKKLVELLTGGNAHQGFGEAVADFPMDRINEKFPNGDYSSWGDLEHIRITQWDILDFIKNSNYKYLQWPKDYWPKTGKKATHKDWQKTIELFQRDLESLREIVEDPKTDLYAKIPWGDGQNILQEILTVADHNAYQLGEFAIMRQVMGTWGKSHK